MEEERCTDILVYRVWSRRFALHSNCISPSEISFFQYSTFPAATVAVSLALCLILFHICLASEHPKLERSPVGIDFREAVTLLRNWLQILGSRDVGSSLLLLHFRVRSGSEARNLNCMIFKLAVRSFGNFKGRGCNRVILKYLISEICYSKFLQVKASQFLIFQLQAEEVGSEFPLNWLQH